MNETAPEILEVTLRDGSYLIDFQFTAADTALIASALESVGFRWIEVGHGVGLNASEAGKGQAAATDEEYLDATAGALHEAKWGMFFIPGIGTEEGLRLAARYGMTFVRVGTNVTEIDQAERYIKLAKDLGLYVSHNPMKSYAVPPEEFGRCAARVRDWGADMVCLVDSAGGMFPEDIERYLRAGQAMTDVPFGFHGHDNLSMAMANTLRAIECGALRVDSSLCGMGRSAGNTVTEILVAILKQRGLAREIDLNAAIDVGQGLIAPIMQGHGGDPLGVTSGYARFHSSYLPKVRHYAEKHQVDVRDVIVRLCQEDVVNAPDDLLERISQDLAHHRMLRSTRLATYRTSESAKLRTLETLPMTLKDIRARAIKHGKFSVLNIVIGEEEMASVAVSGNIQPTPTHVVGSLTLTSEDHLAEALRMADGQVDVIFLDVDRKPFGPAAPASIAKKILTQSLLLTYLDSRTWVQAVEDQVIRMLGEDLSGIPIVIVGDHAKTHTLALRLAERESRITLIAAEGKPAAANLLRSLNDLCSLPHDAAALQVVNYGSEKAVHSLGASRLTVLWPSGKSLFSASEVGHMPPGSIIIDARIGSLVPDAIEAAHNRQITLVRVNIWPALTGAIATAHDSALVCREALGRAVFNEVSVVAGGVIGRRGEVVVDNLKHPMRVIGVADGHGGLLPEAGPEDAARMERVMEEIGHRLISQTQREEGH